MQISDGEQMKTGACNCSFQPCWSRVVDFNGRYINLHDE